MDIKVVTTKVVPKEERLRYKKGKGWCRDKHSHISWGSSDFAVGRATNDVHFPVHLTLIVGLVKLTRTTPSPESSITR